MSDIRLQDPLRNSLDDLIEQAQQDLELERKRQEAIITSEEPDKVLSGLSKVEKQIENEPEEVQRSVLNKAYDPGYFDRGVRGGNISRAIEEYSPVKNQQEKRQPFSEALINDLAGGTADLLGSIASAPGFIYELQTLPRKLVAEVTGLEFLDPTPSAKALTNNPIARYFKDVATHFEEENTRYDREITDYIRQGNVVDALGLTASSIVKSLPYTASIVAGGYVGLPARVILPVVATVTGGGKSATLIEEMPEFSDERRILNSLIDGLAEGGFEAIGSAGIGRQLKRLSGDLTKTLGRKKGNEVLKETIKKTFQDKTSRYIMLKSGNQEGWEEFGTTVVQNLNAQLTGEDPDRELFAGAVDSYIVGFGSGGALSAPTAVQVRNQRKRIEKSKGKVLESLKSGQLRDLSDQEITDFASSLTPEERMEVGIGEDGKFEIGSDLGKEVVRRNLDMDKFPETEKEIREANARLNIKEQQFEGTDFTGALINKIEESTNIKVEREFLDRTLADEAEEQGWTEAETKQVLKEHGLDENSDPSQIDLTGTSFGGSIKISTAGTPERMAQEYVAVQEEMAEEYYKAEQENNPNFDNEIEQERKAYHESTGEQDTGESDIEWFSTKAVHFATQGKVHESIGAKLRDIFKRFIDTSKQILKDAIKLRRAIKEGKVPESLVSKLKEATDFKTVGKKVDQVKKIKSEDSYRLSISEGMEKHRTKPALRAPSKKEKLSKNQIKSRINRLKRDVIPEIENFAKTNPEEFDEAIDWYFNDIRVAIDVLANENQFVKDHPTLFTAIIAITSNGQKVPGQYNDTADVINHFTESNSFPIVDSFTTGEVKKPIKVLKLSDGKQLGGARPGVIGQSMNRLQYIIDQLGLEGAEAWLLTPKTGIEIHEMAWNSGTYKQGNGMPGISKDRKNTAEDYRGMHIFGRKIGNFGLAFWDLNREAVIDVWMSRWYNRHMGTPFNKDGDLQESPRNTSEWNLISQAVSELTDEMNKRYNKNYTVSQIQAVIWYHEKYYYEKNGINYNKGINYSRSANERAKQKGYYKDTKELVSVSDVKGKEQERSGEDKKRVSKEKPSYRLTPTFYSQADRVVTDKFPPTMKSQSVENFLKKNQVKPEEIEWLDLESLLKGKLKITKEELQEWIQANKIDVQDVVFGEYIEVPKAKKQLNKLYYKRSQQLGWFESETIVVKIEGYPDEIRGKFKVSEVVTAEGAFTKITERLQDGKLNPIGRFNKDGYKIYDEVKNPSKYENRFKRLHKLQKEINELESFEAEMKENKDTEYESYQLPGEKEDYRELLLTLPPRPMTFEEFDADARSIGLTDQQVIKNQYVDYLKDPGKDISKDKNFKTGHFKQPNILAHVRFNTRISPTGERILFIEELQSDWHTEGRSKGYKSGKKITKLPEGYTVEKRLGTQYRVLDPNGERFTSDFLSEEFAVKHAIEKLRKIGVPNAPFKGNGWIELIMKRMLRHASDNNFDRIAWTTSNQQIDRWRNDLRQNVDQIQWQKITKSSLEEEIRSNMAKPGGAERISTLMEEVIDQNKNTVIINGLKNKENRFNQTIPLEGETTINGQRVTLEGLLGKQMATQIRNDKKRTGIIEGDDLTIGGQGFKVVYDFAISKILNKMGKKFGAKVDQVDIATEKGTIPKDIVERIKRLSFKRTDIYDKLIIAKFTPSQLSVEDVQSYIDELRTEREKLDSQIQELRSKYKNVITDNAQPSIKITRKMKESALKGQPTFRLSKMSSTDEVLESSSFKKWFKGSQVVDEQGKPLVVYHGSGDSFDQFFPDQFFATDIKDSEYYATGYHSNAPQMYPVYLKIENPIRTNGIAWLGSDENYWEELIDETGINLSLDEAIKSNPDLKELKKESSEFFPSMEEIIFTPYVLDKIKESGFDGIEIDEYEMGTNYVAFKPTQIKSVFNKGTFNPNDPRISFRLSPKNIVTPLAKVYQEQKGNKKSYTKKDWEQDLARLGYDEDMIKSAMDMFGIIRIKQIETTDPTPIEKELQKLQDKEKDKGKIKAGLSKLKDSLKRGYRLGASEKEKEIVSLQKLIKKYIKNNLPRGFAQKREVTSLIIAVNEAKRFRDLAGSFRRVDDVVERIARRNALTKWNKTIKKKATIKKVGGIPKGQVGADVQEIVNDIKSVYKLSEAEVESKLEILLDVIDKSTDGQPTDLQSMQMHNLMTYGSIKSKTPEQIANATQDFDILVTQGRMQIIEETQAYKERMASVRAEILDVITGGAGAQTKQGEQALGLKPKDWSQFRNMLSQFDNMSQSLEYVFDKLSKLDRTSRPLQSFINNYFMPQIRQARLAEYGGTTEMITMMKNKLEEIYGLKGGKLRRKLNENIEKTVTITHHDQISPEGIKGDIVESTLTYNQAYKKWMELKDPTLHKTFVKMGYDVNKVINQIEQQLPKEVLAWAEWQLYEFYPMYYQRVNETFRRRFFVNLPFNPMYSPIKRLIGAQSDTADPTLDKKKTPFGSVQNGSMKSRVGSQEELDWVDGDTVLLSHIAEMEHFIAYTDVLRELRSVFMSRDISRSIQQFHGKPISRVLNKFMDDIARGGIDKSNSVEGIDYLRGNFSRSAIGLNPVVFLKQLGSIPAYASDMPMSHWLAQFTLLSNPIEVKRMLKTLSESKLLDMRYEVGMERDIALAMRSVKPGNVFTGTDMLNNIAYLLTKLGDKTAIYLGGWPLYKYEYKQAKKNGATDKEAKKIAMKKFESSTLRAQQSGEIEDLADVQRSGTYAKLFTMFMTSPNQYYRMAIGGYRNIYHGRGSKVENFRRIFVAQIVLPTLFTFISNGFEYDEEDHITSLILFPFAGIMFFGQAYATIIDRLGGKNYGSAGEVSILEPFNDMARLASRIRQIQLGKKELDSKQVIAMVNDIVIAMSRILGLPYAGVKRSVLGAIKVVKGEAVNPIRETIGFKPKKKEKKKLKRVTAEPTFSQ